MTSPGISFFHVFWFLLIAVQCQKTDEVPFRFVDQGREVPSFSSDAARDLIRQQVGFGPRNPGSEGHREMGLWLQQKLERYAGSGNVFVQPFTFEEDSGNTLHLKNFIASFNLQSQDRILLAAHWDTRPRADEDPERPEEPIAGADDGGSGTGVLLELSRILNEFPPPIGVDLLFFDGEDYGKTGSLDHYFLGSRYWGSHPPVEGYRPRFGILLDMVGGLDAHFPKEGFSVQFAPALVDAIWETAHEIGLGNRFTDEQGARVYDDHVIVERLTGIPMINIIHHTRRENGTAQFPPWWHTLEDTMDIIDTNTLQAVGDLIVELLYNRIK